MDKLKIAYFGSPNFSADFLEKILADKSLPVEVEFVVTQPDRPAGRKRILTPCPVKKLAGQKNLEVLLIEDLKSNKDLGIKDLDFVLLYAFGKIIPKELLNLPKYGFLNVHPSLLPKYRGPSPIATPLVNGDKTTGVTLIRMDERIDHGPIIAQEKIDILPDDRRPDLEKKLTDLAYRVFGKVIISLIHQPATALNTSEQDDKKATYTKLLNKTDGFIEFMNLKLKILNSPKELFDLFRGLYPWPGLWTLVKIKGFEKRLKIVDMGFKDGKLTIKKVQLEGKKEVDWKTFKKGYDII
ncbi:methionyl-tRNA formyltransferase [Candidatus Roizmanbacteria bacterium]|jgi:methionyl-tRNA formyltransferase|nr:methionyl-tRNA formyltransferase [Candidatus Roizmanbacteria bacterium]